MSDGQVVLAALSSIAAWETARWAVRRPGRRERERAIVLAAVRDGHRYAYPLSRVTGVRPGRLMMVLHALERDGVIVGAFDGPSPEAAHAHGLPRRRAYTPAPPASPVFCGDPVRHDVHPQVDPINRCLGKA